jgi:hypothetical protein
MSALVTARVHRLAGSLTELKTKVRAALATELAGAVGTTVRDVLVVVLLDRLIATPSAAPARRDRWPEGRYDRPDRGWDEARDPWADPDERDESDSSDALARYRTEGAEEREPHAPVPAAAAVAVGVTVGRWWLSRTGRTASAVGIGALATTLGLAGGPVTRAALAVLGAAADLLTAEAALARPEPL